MKKLIITLFYSFTVSMKALFARSTEQDAGNEENIEEKMKENINDILKLLDELSEKAEACGGRLECICLCQ